MNNHITVIFNDNKDTDERIINKTHSIKDSVLHTTSNARVSKFTAIKLHTPTLTELSQTIQSLEPYMALILGTHSNDLEKYSGSTKALADNVNVFSRTADTFNFSSYCMLDYDVEDQMPEALKFKSTSELINTLSQVMPEIAETAFLVKNSSSANLFDASGESLTGDSAKRHLFFQVKDPSDLPRFKTALFCRCWLAGLGYTKQSKSDSNLLRTIFDYQTSTTLAGSRQLTWPVSWFDFKACFFR